MFNYLLLQLRIKKNLVLQNLLIVFNISLYKVLYKILMKYPYNKNQQKNKKLFKRS